LNAQINAQAKEWFWY